MARKKKGSTAAGANRSTDEPAVPSTTTRGRPKGEYENQEKVADLMMSLVARAGWPEIRKSLGMSQSNLAKYQQRGKMGVLPPRSRLIQLALVDCMFSRPPTESEALELIKKWLTTAGKKINEDDNTLKGEASCRAIENGIPLPWPTTPQDVGILTRSLSGISEDHRTLMSACQATQTVAWKRISEFLQLNPASLAVFIWPWRNEKPTRLQQLAHESSIDFINRWIESGGEKVWGVLVTGSESEGVPVAVKSELDNFRLGARLPGFQLFAWPRKEPDYLDLVDIWLFLSPGGQKREGFLTTTDHGLLNLIWNAAGRVATEKNKANDSVPIADAVDNLPKQLWQLTATTLSLERKTRDEIIDRVLKIDAKTDGAWKKANEAWIEFSPKD